MASISRHASERGNGLTEMLLFTPLAILFFTAVIDGGFALQDRSALVEALRSGLHSHPAYITTGLPLLAEAQSVVAGVAAETARSVARARDLSDDTLPDRFAAEVLLIELSIDPRSGQMLTYRVAAAATVGEHNMSLSDSVDDYFGPERDLLPSPFAVPLPRRTSGGDGEYLSTAYALAGGVVADSRGLCVPISSFLLARRFTVRELQVVPLRSGGE